MSSQPKWGKNNDIPRWNRDNDIMEFISYFAYMALGGVALVICLVMAAIHWLFCLFGVQLFNVVCGG